MIPSEFKKLLNMEIYKVNTATKSDMILQDNNSQVYYSDTTMSKIYNIIKDEHPQLLFFLYICENPKAQENFPELYNDGIFDIKKFEKLERENIMRRLNESSKELFLIFRLYIDTITTNVFSKTFKPIDKKIIECDNLKYFNTYVNNCKFANLKPELNDDFPHIKFLLQNILQNGNDYFINFLSWKIVNPLEPVDCHFVIQDDGGTGKTKILSNIISKLVNCVTISQKDLENNHNEYMINALFVLAEEIEGYENEKQIKYYTGVGGQIRINPKNISAYNIINYSNWIFLSNDKKSLKITDKDRRFIVIGGGKRLTPLSNGDWSNTLFPEGQLSNYEFFDSEKGYHKSFEKEIKRFYQYLIALNVQKKDLLINLPTMKKQELIEMNYTSEKKFMIEILDLNINNMIITYLPLLNNSKIKLEVKNYIYKIPDNKVNGTELEYWIKSFDFFEIYRAYCKHNNFQHTLNKHNFFLKIPDLPEYNLLFNEKKVINMDNKRSQYIKFKDYEKHIFDMEIPVTIKDENKDIKPSEPIDMSGEKKK